LEVTAKHQQSYHIKREGEGGGKKKGYGVSKKGVPRKGNNKTVVTTGQTTLGGLMDGEKESRSKKTHNFRSKRRENTRKRGPHSKKITGRRQFSSKRGGSGKKNCGDIQGGKEMTPGVPGTRKTNNRRRGEKKETSKRTKN